MSTSTILAALGAMAKEGGSYYSQVHAETSRKNRLLEARKEAERIYQRNKADGEAAAIEARRLKRQDVATDRTNANEDARTRVDYQIEQQDAANERRRSADATDDANTWEPIEVFNTDGTVTIVEQNKLGEIRDASAEAFQNGARLTDPTKGNRPIRETESQRRGANFLYRMGKATESIKGYLDDPELDVASMTEQLVQYTDINMIKKPKLRQYASAMSDWLRAKLRKESGAVIGDKEAMDEAKLYFPWPGDDAETLAEKRRRRSYAEMGLYKEVRGANATEEEFVEEYGDPWGIFSKGTNGEDEFNAAFSKY